MQEWLAVLGVAAFLLAFGKFLDKYHISSKNKDQVRSLLVRAFISIDAISFPELPRLIGVLLFRPDRPIGLLYIVLLLCIDVAVGALILFNPLVFVEFGGSEAPLFLIIAAIAHVIGIIQPSVFLVAGVLRAPVSSIPIIAFVAFSVVVLVPLMVIILVPIVVIRRCVNRPPRLRKLSFVLHFSSLPIIIAFMCVSFVARSVYPFTEDGTLYHRFIEGVLIYGLGVTVVLLPIVIFSAMRYVFSYLYDASIAVIMYFSPLLTVAYATVCIIALLAFGSVLYDGAEEVILLIAVSMISPVILIIVVVVIVFCAKVFLDLTRKIALQVFEAASAPEVSPFSYAAALLGILVLGVKLALGRFSSE